MAIPGRRNIKRLNSLQKKQQQKRTTTKHKTRRHAIKPTLTFTHNTLQHNTNRTFGTSPLLRSRIGSDEIGNNNTIDTTTNNNDDLLGNNNTNNNNNNHLNFLTVQHDPTNPHNITSNATHAMLITPHIRITRQFKRYFSTSGGFNSDQARAQRQQETANPRRWTPPNHLPPPEVLLSNPDAGRKFDDVLDRQEKRAQREHMAWRKAALTHEHAATLSNQGRTQVTHQEIKDATGLRGKKYNSRQEEIEYLTKKAAEQAELLQQLETQEQTLLQSLAAQKQQLEQLRETGGVMPGMSNSVTGDSSGKGNIRKPDMTAPLTKQQLDGLNKLDLHPNSPAYQQLINEELNKYQNPHMGANTYSQADYEQYQKFNTDYQKHGKPVQNDINNPNNYTMNSQLLQARLNADSIHQNAQYLAGQQAVSAEQQLQQLQAEQQFWANKKKPYKYTFMNDLSNFLKHPFSKQKRKKLQLEQEAYKLFNNNPNAQNINSQNNSAAQMEMQIKKMPLSHRLKRLSPIFEQGPYHLKHTWKMLKQVTSPETWLLFKAEFQQSRKVVFSQQNFDRTKLEFRQRLKFLGQELDKKLKEPYIEPTTEYRLQKKEILHDNIIDAHYAKDRMIDKIRSKMRVVSKTIEAMNEDPRKRDVLIRKFFFTSLDDDSSNTKMVLNRILKITYFPFGLVLRAFATAIVVSLFTAELLFSRLIPELGIILRTTRKNLESFQLTPNNVLQLILLTSLSLALLAVSHDAVAWYVSNILTPRGLYVDAGRSFVLVNSEEMLYDSIRELVINRLVVTSETYQEMYDKTVNKDPRHTPDWGTADRYAQTQSLIQPIFTQMKKDLVLAYKDHYYLPFERLLHGLRTHTLSLGFTIEALDGFLDTLYLRDTGTAGKIGHEKDMYYNNPILFDSPHKKITDYLLANKFLTLPPQDVVRNAKVMPNDILHYVMTNFKQLEGKDPILGGELFQKYLELGGRLAYRKKLLSELENLDELRKALQNAHFPHIHIPSRDIQRIAADPNDPTTKLALYHLTDLRVADHISPLYPNRAARQFLESSYQIDDRHTHYAGDKTQVNDHYLMLVNADNQRYSYSSLVEDGPYANTINFRNDEERLIFEKHVYHLGLILHKLDAIMVQNFLELRRVDGILNTALEPLPTEVVGIKMHTDQQHKLKLPSVDEFLRGDLVDEKTGKPLQPHVDIPLQHGLLHLTDSPGMEVPASQINRSMSDERVHPLTDQVEYDAHHYRTMIDKRKAELREKFDIGQYHVEESKRAVGPSSFGNSSNNSIWGQISNVVFNSLNTISGGIVPSGTSSTGAYNSKFSEEYEHLIDKQAQRDVLEKIQNDPTLYTRYLKDHAKDQLIKLKNEGYLSTGGFVDQMGGNPYNVMAGSYDFDPINKKYNLPNTDGSFNVLDNVDDNLYYKVNPNLSALKDGQDALNYEANVEKSKAINRAAEKYKIRGIDLESNGLQRNPIDGTIQSSSSVIKNIFNPVPQKQAIPTQIDAFTTSKQYEQHGYSSPSRSYADKRDINED